MDKSDRRLCSQQSRVQSRVKKLWHFDFFLLCARHRARASIVEDIKSLQASAGIVGIFLLHDIAVWWSIKMKLKLSEQRKWASEKKTKESGTIMRISLSDESDRTDTMEASRGATMLCALLPSHSSWTQVDDSNGINSLLNCVYSSFSSLWHCTKKYKPRFRRLISIPYLSPDMNFQIFFYI